MLIVTGTAEIDPTRRDEALAEAVPLMQASQAEAGCIEYVFLPDPTAPNRIRIFEQWESQEALTAHFGEPHFAAAGELLGRYGVANVDIQKYEIASVGPVFE